MQGKIGGRVCGVMSWYNECRRDSRGKEKKPLTLQEGKKRKPNKHIRLEDKISNKTGNGRPGCLKSRACSEHRSDCKKMTVVEMITCSSGHFWHWRGESRWFSFVLAAGALRGRQWMKQRTSLNRNSCAFLHSIQLPHTHQKKRIWLACALFT